MKNLTLFFLAMFVVITTSTMASAQSNATLQADEVLDQTAAERYMEVVYDGAAVYAAKTVYAFVREDGNRMFVPVHEMEEDRQWDPKMPNNMIASGDGADGVAEANPEMVGKTFLLVFGTEGDRITEVRLKE